jgi:catechol 2,3-dioxygenase-like lactoylglutathione lyase family enzyme
MADQDRAATKDMDQLLTSYEKGTLTRRELLSALALVGTSMSASAQPTVSPLQGRASMFHHVNIFVSNLPRSAAFYQKLGLPSTLRPIYPAPGGAAYGLDFNNGSFLSLIQTADPERVGTIDHFSIGIDNFDYERDTAAIKAAGITPAEVDRIELLHMTDPDGIAVQMTDTTNTIDCPRGIGMPPCEPVPGQAPR